MTEDQVRTEMEDRWGLRQRVLTVLRDAGFDVQYQAKPGSDTSVLIVKESEELAQLQERARKLRLQPHEIEGFLAAATWELGEEHKSAPLGAQIAFIFSRLGAARVKELLDEVGAAGPLPGGDA